MLKMRGDRGAEAVEFALLVPLLMLLLLGIMEFAFAFVTQASLAGAARQGVRYYTINYATPGAANKAIEIAKAATPNPSDVVGGTFSAACTPSGSTTLTLTYRYHTLTGAFDELFGGAITINGIGSMQCGG